MSVPRSIGPASLRTLRLLAESGATRAAAALAKWSNARIGLTVTRVSAVPVSDVPSFVGGSEVLLVGLLMRITGELDGNLLVAFPEDAAQRLIALLTGKAPADAEAWTPLDRSAVEETANIVGNAFFSALVSAVELSARPGAPHFAHDMAGAILEEVLMEQAEVSDQVLLMEISLSRGDYAEAGLGACHIFLLPAPASQEKILAQLGLVEHGTS